jgi:hypothetical protein
MTRSRLVWCLFYRHMSAIEQIIHRSMHFILCVLRRHRKMSWVTWESKILISSLCEFLIIYPYGPLTMSWEKRSMLLLWCATYGHEWFGLLGHYWESSWFWFKWHEGEMEYWLICILTYYIHESVNYVMWTYIGKTWCWEGGGIFLEGSKMPSISWD